MRVNAVVMHLRVPGPRPTSEGMPVMTRLFPAAVAAALLIGCGAEAPGAANDVAGRTTAATQPAVQHQGPALWKVADADTTIYLFGTVHMLPDGFDWQSDVVDKAFDSADTLVLEVIGTDDARLTQPVIAELGFTPGLPKLVDRVPADQHAGLNAAIRDAGVPVAALDPMETWLATMMLSTARIVKLGYGIDSGVEGALKTRAVAGRKRIEGLETLREQLGFFDTLPESDQRQLLVASLDDMESIGTLVNTTVRDWAAGDVEKVAAALESDIQGSPDLAKRLLADRNANWANWVENRLATTPGTVFMAVGTGHLAGKDSLQAQLKAKGVKAIRLN